MNKEIKLGIGVAVLCIALFLLVIGIGNSNKGKENNPSTENLITESTEEIEGTESLGTEVDSDEIQSEENGEYVNFAIADVTDYVNVRQEPNTDSAILGKLYDGAVAQILATVGEGDNQWFQIISGNVEGYIKAEYFIHGNEAAAVMDQYVSQYVKVNADRLNVREGQTTDSRRIGYVCVGEELELIENCGEWIQVQYTDEITGYVSAQYVTVEEEYIYAKNAEDEKAEKEFIKVLKERAGISEEVVKEETNISVKPPSTTYSTSVELRKAIIDYAMQYLGDRYVHGGQSLATGTDCSGFTMYVLREFGINIGRTPQSQFTSAGRSISYSEVQPGDIICYSSNGGRSCTHVAFYIGDGKILHAANSRDGVKISSATYDDIYGVRNVID
ncbi:MAG: C40 family peptidase [Agathobacter sp.]|nr:C40 family peptidase [Agathobacter sp.]